MPIKKTWRPMVVGAVIAASFIPAGSAFAGPAPAGATTPPAVAPLDESTCAHPELWKAFSIFGDQNDYAPAPGGTFDDPTGWQLTKGAKIVQTLQPDGSTGGALELAGKSQATSPPMCITADYPMARLWSRTVSGDDSISFNVQYYDRTTGQWTGLKNNGEFAGPYYWDQGFDWSSYTDWAQAWTVYAASSYGQWTKNAGYVAGVQAGWRLTPDMAVTPSAVTGWQQVRFTFYANGDPRKSKSQIDDFLVDPRASR